MEFSQTNTRLWSTRRVHGMRVDSLLSSDAGILILSRHKCKTLIVSKLAGMNLFWSAASCEIPPPPIPFK